MTIIRFLFLIFHYLHLIMSDGSDALKNYVAETILSLRIFLYSFS